MLDLLVKREAELVDFASCVSQPRHIDIQQRLAFGSVTIGRYAHNFNDGALIGTAQCTVLVHEGSMFELDWGPLDERKCERKRISFGDVQIHPCDALVYKRWRTPSQMLFLAVDRSFVDRVASDAFGLCHLDLEMHIGVNDPVIGGMAEAWREELRTSGAGGKICAEALATALIVHLFRTYVDSACTQKIALGGMTGAKLRKVITYIQEHLSEDIGLDVLAAVSGFSVHHFVDVFKSETGFTPHQFLINRRIHRAKELLLGSDTSIAQIAIEVGFSGQSHLSGHFRKLTGATPLRFRKANGSFKLQKTDNFRQKPS
jgi:AraC family transcriptional regulator